MITTLITSTEKLKFVQSIIDEFNPIIFLNDDNKTPFQCFIETLDTEVDDYRLHLSGDIILSDDLKSYIPLLINFMSKNNSETPMLSLSAPVDKRLTIDYFLGKRVTEYRNDRYNILDNRVTLYSKKFIKTLKKCVSLTKEKNDDVAFVNQVLDRTGTITYIHLPLLAQYDNNVKNMDNNKNKQYSNLFEKNYVKEFNKR